MALPHHLATAVNSLHPDVTVVEPQQVMTLGTHVRLGDLAQWQQVARTIPQPLIVVACDIAVEDGAVAGHSVTIAHAGIAYTYIDLEGDYILTGLDTARRVDDHGIEVQFEVSDDEHGDDRWNRDWANRNYNQLTDQLKTVVDDVIARHDYTGWGDDHIIRNNFDLSPTDFTAVAEAATEQYRNRVWPALEDDARKIISTAQTKPGFHPAGDLEAVYKQATEELDVDPRAITVVRNVEDEFGLDWQSREQATEELRRDVEPMLTELFDQQSLDRLGFTSRRQMRNEMLQPLYDRYPETLHDRLYRIVNDVDRERWQIDRERRFLAAANTLIERKGWTKAATCRELGISSSVLDRLYRDHQHDLDELQPGDWLHRLVHG